MENMLVVLNDDDSSALAFVAAWCYKCCYICSERAFVLVVGRLLCFTSNKEGGKFAGMSI